MAELDRLFTEFVERHLAGEEPDPWSYIDQLSGDEREELEELIDAYFVGAPPRSWDAAAYRGSSAERIADALDRSFRGQAGLWPAVLPRLRDRAQLTRGALVERLAERSGSATAARRWPATTTRWSRASCPPRGCRAGSSTLWPGSSARAPRPCGGPASRSRASHRARPRRAVFARKARPAPEYGPPGEAMEARDEDRAAEWDEVDELFRGG